MRFVFGMRATLILLFLFITFNSNSQLGGNYAFSFIDLAYNARSAALGGNYISVKDGDLNIGINNPSLLNSEMTKKVSLSQSLMSGGINYGMTDYAFQLKDIGVMSTYIKYVNYGKFNRTSINGTSEGTFTPFEMVMGAGLGRSINERISVGGNLNFIFSQLEGYSSFGVGIDLAGTYYDEDKRILVTAMAKNAGVQFNAYAKNGNRAPLPTDFQLATSYKLEHAPFRFTLLAHHLNKWDLTYNDPTLVPTIDPLTGDTNAVERAGVVEKIARHFTYQLEAPLSKNFHLRIGFNYHRRKELGLETRPGAAGFSFGTALYFKKFSLDYGFVVYSSAGFNNMISFTVNMDKWRK